MIDAREWGDGVGNDREHEIADISFSLGSIACKCGSYVGITRGKSLEEVWDLHRGLLAFQTVVRRSVDRSLLATDDEVSEFLRSVSGEGPTLMPRSSVRTAETIDTEAVAALLDYLDEFQSHCKCGDGRSVTECPNYIPGDEEIYE